MIKKKNIISVNLSSKAIQVLQAMNYINGNKKSTGFGSVSKFVSMLIEDYLFVHPGLDENEINIKIYKANLNELRIKQNTLNEEVIKQAGKLSIAKAVLNAKIEGI